MRHTTPFFDSFGPLLFGKPPVSALAQTFAKLSECKSLGQLRKLFGSCFPQKLLDRRPSGANSRKRVFSLEVVFWSFLDQVQTPQTSCREAVRKVMAFTRRRFPREKDVSLSPDSSAYCQARARIPLEVMDEIHAHLVERLQNHISLDELWHGRQVRIVDGTGISMPDTPENQAHWPQSKNQRPGCGFPSMKLVGLFCMLSGALIKVTYSDRRSHESRLFQELWSALNKNDLLVADRGFCSFATIATLLARGVDSLMRLPEKKIRLAIGAQLPKASNFDKVITWNRPAKCPSTINPSQFELLPETISVRIVRYTIANRGFRSRCVTLVTTLLDASIPAAELTALYFRRWSIELHFREIKTHLHMDVLRCLSPDMIERELRMHFISYNLIRCIMQKAARIHAVALERISFKGSLDTLRQFANAAIGAEDKPRTISALIEEMLLAIARDPLPLRPGRTEPRVRKRRPKNYRLLTKPRHKMGRLPHRKIGIESAPKPRLT
jgi:hypothetical protein